MAKRLLKGKRFKGNYLEKRYAASLESYKDIIVVSAAEEHNFHMDCNIFMDICSTPFDWMAITNAMTGNKEDYWIWTDLDQEDLPFGEYFFEVKSVKSIGRNTHVKLKLLTKAEDHHQHGDAINNALANISLSDFEPKKVFLSTATFLRSIEWNGAKIKQTIELLLFSIIYFITEIPNIIRYVGIFVLALVKELNNFIHVSTPLVMACLNIIQKTMGAIFMLVYSLVNPKSRNRPPQYQSIRYR